MNVIMSTPKILRLSSKISSRSLTLIIEGNLICTLQMRLLWPRICTIVAYIFLDTISPLEHDFLFSIYLCTIIWTTCSGLAGGPRCTWLRFGGKLFFGFGFCHFFHLRKLLVQSKILDRFLGPAPMGSYILKNIF